MTQWAEEASDLTLPQCDPLLWRADFNLLPGHCVMLLNYFFQYNNELSVTLYFLIPVVFLFIYLFYLFIY